MPGLIKDSRILIGVTAFDLCDNVDLMEIYEKYPSPHGYQVGMRQSVLVAFLVGACPGWV